MSNYLSQSWLIDRRHALRALGTFIALPMLECMIPLRATEAASAAPRRSAFIYLANGVHSLNYQITLIIIIIALCITIVGIFLVWLVGLASLVLVIIATIRASENKLYRYPVNFRFIK